MTIPALSTRVDKTRLGRDGPSIDRVTAAARDVDHAAQRLAEARDGLAAAIRESIETGESGELRRNRGRRIAQDRRRGPPSRGTGTAGFVPCSCQHCRNIFDGLRNGFFYGRTFTSDDDLNAQALH